MKTRIVLAIIVAFISLTAFYSTEESAKATPLAAVVAQKDFEQYPPYAVSFWVQQLEKPLNTGETMIFSVELIRDDILPDTLVLYDANGKEMHILRDDGTEADLTKDDGMYSCYLKEDIAKLKTRIQAAEDYMIERKNILSFKGHVGEVTSSSKIPKFDFQSFTDFKLTEISGFLVDRSECIDLLKKENSLFITDLAVVEDLGRTYNVATAAGTPNGAWTFGTLMANMENGLHADGLRGFLKEWVRHWVEDQVVNGYNIERREFTIVNLIEPWLRKATGQPSLDVNEANWEALWDATDVSNLRINSPFKLTAIVNRIDLRGNIAYNPSVTNAGETRFIYTLINPVTGGYVINPNQTASAEGNGVGFIDWRGLNVIFEYGNPLNTRCAIRDFGQEWLDLSDAGYSFGTPNANNAYKDALQAVTDQVTAANAAPSKTNGSAINRVRTNEKAFASFSLLPTGNSEARWEAADWEFRQFELDATGHGLKMVPLTNNPDHTANFAPNIEEDGYGTNQIVNNSDILNWIFNGHRLQLINGNFNLPQSLLSGSGIVRREETQYFDFQPDLFATAGGYDIEEETLEAKTIRHQLSLNTCAGCHAGETKTVFTHVNALAYEESNRYWTPMADGAVGVPQDENLYPHGDNDPLQVNGRNNGLTLDLQLGQLYNLWTASEIEDRGFFQGVSPFITGRRYYDDLVSPNSGLETWQDDEPDDANDDDGNFEPAPDDDLRGLFYVNDPSNDDWISPFPHLSMTKNGFNDLQRRLDDLCVLVGSDCSPSGGSGGVFPLKEMLKHVPLPKGGH